MPSIFVTGAGKGIGRAIVERFAAAGWDVAGVTRSAADVDSLNRLGAGGSPRFWRADAAEAGEIAAVADEFTAGGAGLDLLVNNAGGFRHGSFRDTEAATLDALWQGNVVSAFTVTQALLPALIRAGGRIANIVSIAALRPLPGKAAYSATKFGLRGFHEVLVEELRGTGVRACLIEPAATDTPLWDPLDPDADPDLPDRSQMLHPEHVAQPRGGTERDVPFDSHEPVDDAV
ncbi:MAG: SDR family oxidoreductase [Planctomycetes bacterium]|nr:SDR family oxidoreductase [Planctomycetota bacterium]